MIKENRDTPRRSNRHVSGKRWTRFKLAHAGAHYPSYCRRPPPCCSPFPAEGRWHNPPCTRRHGAAPVAPLRERRSRPPARPRPRWGAARSFPGPLPAHTHLLFLRCGGLGDFRGHTAPSADETPGKDAITGWPRPPGRLKPSRPRPPSPCPGRLRPRKWPPPPPYDDTELQSTQRVWPSGRQVALLPLPSPRTAPLPTLTRSSDSATPKHFLSFFKGRGSRLTSHPPVGYVLGLVVSRRSCNSPAVSGLF